VYNWTDSPSIISGRRLLILDPHYEWSTGETQGGPVYDFVKDCGTIEMKNHMAAYTSVIKQLDEPFAGTIIRIPLRTREQALKSEISNRTTTVSEVVEVFKIFASEFGDSGLLFMRNIERLELTSDTISIAIEMTDVKNLRS
jgi:sacsin